MSYNYVLHDKAQQEYDKAVEWYANKSIKAAENLVAEVEKTLCLICNNPDRWRNEFMHYRELGLKKYPYVIIYVVDEKNYMIIVMAIFHTSRSPKKKYRKI